MAIFECRQSNQWNVYVDLSLLSQPPHHQNYVRRQFDSEYHYCKMDESQTPRMCKRRKRER